MITTITEKGTLNIKPESELESFALKVWFDDYTKKEGNCSLSIETIEHKGQ